MAIAPESHYIYTVKSGDTLYSIANRFGSTVNDIERSNVLYPPMTDPGLIFPGQVLAIPIVGAPSTFSVSYIIKAGDALYSIARRFGTVPDLLAGINPNITNPNVIYQEQLLLVPAFIYEVVQGDTLFRISRQHGIPISNIITANQGRPGLSTDLLFPGYRFIIPLPSSANLAVFRPLPGAPLAAGQRLEGYARAFEAAVQYQIKDDNNRTVTDEQAFMTSAGAPAYGHFSIPLFLSRQPSTAQGETWVYTRSPRDGSIQDLVQVRITFASS